MYNEIELLNQRIAEESRFVDPLLAEVRKHIVGQADMVEKILIGLLTGGHILLEGVPGLAKTKTISAVAHAVDASFQRIQFTPDLLPADLIGTMIYNQHDGKFTTRKGPVFTHIVLADEINRAPAKVQSALLEAMQEKQVTIAETTYALPEPFFVLATQNPIEQEGTYPLPEAQVDRFMLKVKVEYPSRDDELHIMDLNTGKEETQNPVAVVKPETLLAARKTVREIYMDEKIKKYIVDIVFATRKPQDFGLKDLAGFIEWGASPRASINLNLAARAHAFLRHRGYVTPEDVKAVGYDVLRHRITPSFEAEAENLTSEALVRKIFDHVEVP